MRMVLYNMRYGTGGGFRLPWQGYLRQTGSNVDVIASFLQGLNPDIVGLVEVDAGSFRHRSSQAARIAERLGHYHAYMSKYHADSLINRIPVLNRQGNAFLTRDTIKQQQFHYFDKGVKRLVIELELESLTVFLVHLSLKFRIRHHQLQQLYAMVKTTRKPHIVAGDFNPLWGDHETALFLGATGLVSANRSGQATFPSWKPKRQLDFLFHSPEVKVQHFEIPAVPYSDHLPLVCDFTVSAS
ncbi:MAG TPA: endonuclease [Verrucomicrobia bacterium]|nr:endonuclease [Verrucomicrobiota bacterium]